VTISIWRDAHDSGSFHVGTRFAGQMCRWATLSDEGLQELFGDDIQNAADAMPKFDVLTVDVEARLPEHLEKAPY
jgi:hypothetical protein